MTEDVQFSSILGLYHGKSAKVAGNPRNFKKSPGNHSIMEGMNGMNSNFLWFCPKREPGTSRTPGRCSNQYTMEAVDLKCMRLFKVTDIQSRKGVQCIKQYIHFQCWPSGQGQTKSKF